MKRNVLTIHFVLVVLLVSLLLVPAAGAIDGEPPGVEEVRVAIEQGVAWLAAQQDGDGFWGNWEQCAVTALAVKKLEHHAVDPKWGWGLDSPFDDAYPYKENVEKGLNWLFENCAFTMEISDQTHGNPDSDGDGIGVYWDFWSRTYSSGIALMTLCEAAELDRVVESGPLAGWTYEKVARDTMDYLAFGQNDESTERGGWGYSDNTVGWSDQSNSGYVALGLGFAEAAPPEGCGFEVPQFVKDELNIWISNIQNADGGSGYRPGEGSNILRTGNLLQQMAFVGDTPDTPRVQSALGYMASAWDHPSEDPGWSGGGGTASYQATFTAMKGFTSLGIHEFGDPPIDWQTDFETVLLAQQNGDGFWSGCIWGDETLCTTWALLTLQKVAPPPAVPVDIKPTSCRNPLNVGAKGVLPVAILGTEDFDVTQVDPASVELEGVSPLRWSLEDVATPYEPYLGKEDAYDCTEEGPDGFMDLTLKFDTQEVVAALGNVSDGDVLVLQLTGNLLEEGSFVGEDVVVILKKGK